ncbi:hypothetical protein LY78DRAFT_7944 [Colletotrichum sublineola]|nr:hypothetical protein LY78DRAFT_7944 [Colletotrichum sublineola]
MLSVHIHFVSHFRQVMVHESCGIRGYLPTLTPSPLYFSAHLDSPDSGCRLCPSRQPVLISLNALCITSLRGSATTLYYRLSKTLGPSNLLSWAGACNFKVKMPICCRPTFKRPRHTANHGASLGKMPPCMAPYYATFGGCFQALWLLMPPAREYT